jgi:hypothetical protein
VPGWRGATVVTTANRLKAYGIDTIVGKGLRDTTEAQEVLRRVTRAVDKAKDMSPKQWDGFMTRLAAGVESINRQPRSQRLGLLEGMIEQLRSVAEPADLVAAMNSLRLGEVRA